ncbi:hypothetical protein STEG23_016774 [Scotinomys teguina]
MEWNAGALPTHLIAAFPPPDSGALPTHLIAAFPPPDSGALPTHLIAAFPPPDSGALPTELKSVTEVLAYGNWSDTEIFPNDPIRTPYGYRDWPLTGLRMRPHYELQKCMKKRYE